MKTIQINNKQDLSNFKQKYFWPGIKNCNPPKEYPCLIQSWHEIPMERSYRVEYLYCETLKELIKDLQEKLQNLQENQKVEE